MRETTLWGEKSVSLCRVAAQTSSHSYAKAPYTLLKRVMHIHSTVAEFIPTMLDDLVPLPGSVARWWPRPCLDDPEREQ
jgi:hypothetical protein